MEHIRFYRSLRNQKRLLAAESGETACPTIDSKQLALVAQAVSPADFDFFTASNGRGSVCAISSTTIF